METPTDVMVHNELLGVKGARARLLQISPHGFYELNLEYGDRRHRTLLPVTGTVLIAPEPEDGAAELVSDLER